MKPVMICAAATLFLSVACQLEAGPTLSKSSYSFRELDNSAGTFTTYGGVAQDGALLYYGNFNTVVRYDLAGESNSVYAATVSNADTKALGIVGSTLYLAMDTSYSAPFPSNLGTVDPVNRFIPTLSSGTEHDETTYSIYDAAVYNGEYYFVANPGTINTNDQQWPTGTCIYRYNAADPVNPFEIANIGGTSGGIAFDAAGNLYYASQNWGEGILRFEAAALPAGGLTAADGTMVVDAIAGYLGFFPDGTLAATTSWGTGLAVFDPVTGNKLRTIATAPSDWSESMGKFVIDGSTLFMVYTYWNDYYGALLAFAITEPEGYDDWISAHFPAAYPGDEADSDKDGYDNFSEFITATSPTNALDKLVITIAMTDGQPHVAWTPDAVPGRLYTLRGRESLTTGGWSVTNAASRFFRVKVDLE